jgi:hypothetical protein
MAEKIPPHGVFYYNAKGQNRHCTTPADIVNAKKDGYTSARYVRSNWPTTVYNKKTGETKRVGLIDWTDEQNMAAVEKMGADWGLDYVVAPDPTPKKDPDHKATGHLEEIIALLAGQKDDSNKRLDDLEAALLDSQATREALERRVAELEASFK